MYLNHNIILSFSLLLCDITMNSLGEKRLEIIGKWVKANHTNSDTFGIVLINFWRAIIIIVFSERFVLSAFQCSLRCFLETYFWVIWLSMWYCYYLMFISLGWFFFFHRFFVDSVWVRSNKSYFKKKSRNKRTQQKYLAF